MRDLLRRKLALALKPDGWVPATPTRESSFQLAEFLRPVDGDMAATATVGRASSFPDRPPVHITHVFAGVCYEPLRRLWTLLGDDYRLALIHEQVFPDDSDEHHKPDLKVSTDAEAEVAVDTLARVILSEAVPFAERYGTVEQLLREFGDETGLRRPARGGGAGGRGAVSGGECGARAVPPVDRLSRPGSRRPAFLAPGPPVHRQRG